MANLKIDDMNRKEKIEYGFSRGLNKSQVCVLAGISRPTLDKYLEEHPKFNEKIEVLRENVKMHARLNIAKKVIDDNDIEASRYILEKTDKEFAPKPKMEVHNNGDGIIQFIDDIPDTDEEVDFSKEKGEGKE